MSDAELQRVAEYGSESLAILAKAILEDHNISVMISGLEPSALGMSLDGDEPIELFVDVGKLQEAKQLLENLEADSEDQGDAVPAWTCACGEDVDEGFFVCWSCGNEYAQQS